MSLEQLKKLIMQEFEKNNCKENEIVPMRNYRFGILSQLNYDEQNLFANAVNALINEGNIIYEPDGLECLRLTKKGFDSLYKNSLSVCDLERKIMQLFSGDFAKIGTVIPFKNIRFRITSQLNPIEKSRLFDAIESLITKDYLAYRESPLEVLVLRPEGYKYVKSL